MVLCEAVLNAKTTMVTAIALQVPTANGVCVPMNVRQLQLFLRKATENHQKHAWGYGEPIGILQAREAP